MRIDPTKIVIFRFSGVLSCLVIGALFLGGCRPVVVAEPEINVGVAQFDSSRSQAVVLNSTVIAGEQTVVAVQLFGTHGKAWTEEVSVSFAVNDPSYGDLGAVSLSSPGIYQASFTGWRAGVTIRITAWVNGSPLTSAPATVSVSAPAAPSGLLWNAGAAATSSTALAASWVKSISTNIAAQKIRYYAGASCDSLSSVVDIADGDTQSDPYVASGEGFYSFQVVAVDVGGNESASVCSPAIAVDTTPPSVAIAAPANGSYINSTSDSAFYAVSGSCSETGQSVDLKVNGGAAGVAACAGGSFAGTIDTTGLIQGAHTLSAAQTDLAGNFSESAGIAVTKDTLAPIVTGLSDDAVAAKTKTWNFGCDTAPCTFRALIDTSPGTTPSGAFSETPSASQTSGTGTYFIHVQAQDQAGNISETAHASAVLDNTGPGSPSILIAGGDAFTNVSSVSLALFATDAPAEMYVTNVSGCGSGGTWEAYGTTKAAWALGQTNAVATVYAKYRDALGNESSCVSDSITHDDVAPTLAFSAPAENTEAVSGVTISGSCEAGLTVNLSGGGLDSPASTACASGSFSQAIVFTAGDGAKNIVVSQTDAAGNAGSANRDFVRNSSAPASASITIAGGAATTNSSTVSLTLSADASATQMYITNVAGCGSGGEWEAFDSIKGSWTLGQSNAVATVYAKFKNALETESDCVSDTITHDDIAPSVAFVSPEAGTAGSAGLTISGTCEAGLTVNLSGAGLDSPATTACAGGAFTQVIIFTSGDGVKNIVVSQTDAANNTGSDNRDFLKDATGPSSPSVSINSGATHTDSASVNLTLSAGGAPAEMYITNVAGCGSGGTWEAYQTSKTGWTIAQANASASVYVKFRDALLNESSCASDSIVHDDIAPVIAVGSPEAGTAGVSGVTIAGTCEAGLTVNLSGAGLDSPATTSCAAGTFSQAITFTAGDGAKNIVVSQTDLAGNTGTDNRSFTKDSTGPGNPTIVIDAGAAYTKLGSVDLTLSADGAPSEMYITNAAGCGSGGSWEAYNTSKAGWSLGQANQVATVFVKFRDALLNESTCVSDTITHDDIAPVLTFTAPGVNAKGVNGLTIEGTCEAGFTISLSGDLSSPASTSCDSGTFSQAIVFTNGDGTKNIVVAQTDAAGNTGSANRDFVKDATGPELPSVSINAGASYTNSGTVTLTLSATGAPTEMYVTNTAGCSGDGAWEAYATTKAGWSLAQANDAATVYVKFRDELLNESTCASDTIIHDDIAPILSFSSPDPDTVAINGVTIAGSCEGSLTVNLSGTGLDSPASTSCNGGSFSQAIVFTAGDGTKNIVIGQTDAAGNPGSANRNFTKDATPPGSPAILINGGDASTSSTSVTLSLSATGDPTEMYVTNAAGCGADGSWEAYATSRSWTLGQSSGTATVYVKYRDLAGNESACVNDTITMISGSGSFSITDISISGSNVTLTWEAAAGAASYTIKYGNSSGTYTTTFSTSATSPTVVTGVSSTAQDYYFRVIAVNGDGETPSENEAGSRNFAYTGSFADWPVPQGVAAVTANIRGAGGGGGGFDNDGGGTAGVNGDHVYGSISVLDTWTLNVYVGEGGRGGGINDDLGSPGGWGLSDGSTGGNGVDFGYGYTYGGGGGGGSSGIEQGGGGILAQAKGGTGGKSDGAEGDSGGNGGAGGGSNIYPAMTLQVLGGADGGPKAAPGSNHGSNGSISLTWLSDNPVVP